MATQLQRARAGEVAPAMERERRDPETVRGFVAIGGAVIPASHVHDGLSEVRYAFDWRRQFDLALDPERAHDYHDQTLPGDNYKEAHFCSVCGVEFCSMRTLQRSAVSNKNISEEEDFNRAR